MGDGVSIVIPHRGPERLRLLAATLQSMRRCRGVEEIIVSESGPFPCALDAARDHDADYVFSCGTGPFDRAATLNAGTRIARSSEVLWSDGDFLFEPGFLVRAQQEMRACGADFYYPHSRLHFLGEADSEEVIAGRRRASDCSPIRVLMPRCCPGGMGMVRAEFVRRHGGMIEGFRGWGGEDDAWLHKAVLLGRVEVSRHPDQAVWHLYHRDSGSHSERANQDAIRRNPHYAGNVALMDRIRSIRSADEFLERCPSPAHAAPPWPPTSRLAFLAAAPSGDAPAAVLARDWARRIGQVYGVEPSIVVADPAAPIALDGLAADAVAGFADDGAACRALIAALKGREAVLVAGAVAPDDLAPDPDCPPLILARTCAQVSQWRSRGLPVWHRPWQESAAPEGLVAPSLVQPLSHLLGAPRTWRIRIDLERAALPVTALDRPRFWYVGLHDSDGIEILRRDLDAAELREALANDPDHIVIERSVTGPRPPARWTIWPTDRRGRWLDRLSGPVGPECLS